MTAAILILNADDYAMTAGISRSIERLAEARRLSAASAMVTLPPWPGDAKRFRALRPHIATGLHLNLTLATPAGPMPQLAADGRLPPLKTLILKAVSGQLDATEINAEITRQLDLFETAMGHPPDHIDGHQHVHVLPVMRALLLDIVAERYPRRPPLVRDPTDRRALKSIMADAGTKAITVNALAAGFARQANDGFAGFSTFDTSKPYAQELGRALSTTGRCVIAMCHPGFSDAELQRLDPVVSRRDQEHEALMTFADLPARIWHPDRSADGPAIDWSAL
jgi:chitin disaccharide deacetylase